MMPFAHWKTQTDRSRYRPTREPELVAVDKAFEAYEKAKTFPNTVALCRALAVWLRTENSGGKRWRQSPYNNRTESGGKGTVETLLDQLLGANPAFKMDIPDLLAASAPAPAPVIVPGAKLPCRDKDGKHYEIYLQRDENSCGPSCIQTVIQLVHNTHAGEDYLQSLVEKAEATQAGTAYTGSLGSGGLVSGGTHDWSLNGSGTWLVPETLKAAKVPCTLATDVSLLLWATPKKPAIGVVQWKTGGWLHYVVSVGMSLDRLHLKILDPGYGLQYARCLTVAPFIADYKPTDPHNTAGEARWYPWVCSVS
jgi:hypothetical protein